MHDQLSLHPWSAADLPVLERSNTPEMTSFLGGLETPEQLASRHARFLRLWEEGQAWMFTVRVSTEELPVGSIGYWTRHWDNADVYETGWSIATPYQGRGFAARALAACLDHAARYGDRAEVYAFPRIDNAASNALCRSARFRLRGEYPFEYPKGNPIQVNAWSFDLANIR